MNWSFQNDLLTVWPNWLTKLIFKQANKHFDSIHFILFENDAKKHQQQQKKIDKLLKCFFPFSICLFHFIFGPWWWSSSKIFLFSLMIIVIIIIIIIKTWQSNDDNQKKRKDAAEKKKAVVVVVAGKNYWHLKTVFRLFAAWIHSFSFFLVFFELYSIFFVCSIFGNISRIDHDDDDNDSIVVVIHQGEVCACVMCGWRWFAIVYQPRSKTIFLFSISTKLVDDDDDVKKRNGKKVTEKSEKIHLSCCHHRHTGDRISEIFLSTRFQK